jgi:hypothetical protein
MRGIHDKILRLLAHEPKYIEFDDAIALEFGFSFAQYGGVLLGIHRYIEDKDQFGGVACIKRNELVSGVSAMTGLDSDIVDKAVTFATLYARSTPHQDLEPWKLNARPDRMTIRPLVASGDNIYVGPETLAQAQDFFLKKLFAGQWIYNRDLVSKRIRSILESIQHEEATRFEVELEEDLKKITPFVQRKIRSEGKNDKCLKGIMELCPGEIDALSVHKEQKYIILWEAKYIDDKVSARDVIGDLDDFTKEKGYMQKLTAKEDFLRKHHGEILRNFGVSDVEGWKITSCIVFPGPSMLKSILETKHRIINLHELPQFINSLKTT